MQLPEHYYDEIFPFSGAWGMPSRCGLKIIRKAGKSYVIVTELYQDNPGDSVTSAGRLLAEQICRAKGLHPEDVVYLECNPGMNSKLSFYDEEYYEVNFSNPRQATYRLLSQEEADELFDRPERAPVKQKAT
ncbi:MAG: hypothetical protein LBP25_03035 [Tannerellaceae bacterium]|jgi:hypothetical protein|nr:hypothetical protein [Tannerellaceae bacterium]